MSAISPTCDILPELGGDGANVHPQAGTNDPHRRQYPSDGQRNSREAGTDRDRGAEVHSDLSGGSVSANRGRKQKSVSSSERRTRSTGMMEAASEEKTRLITSEQLGQLEIPETQILHFPTGLFGFLEERQFCLLEVKEGSRFQLLQSCERPDLAFVVTNPLLMEVEYPLEEARQLAFPPVDPAEPIGVACIVTVPPPPGKLTVNLAAPLVMGVETKQCVQVILTAAGYTTRHELL